MLFGQSGKLKDIFKGIARSEEGEGPCHTIRPLCPTRWTVRTSAIRTVLNQYECIIKALSEMAVSESDAASKAQGLYETFQQGNVVLGIVCALEITRELEVLNMSLQSSTQNLDGMLSAVAFVKESFSKKRNTESFQALYTKASRMCETLHLTPIAVSHLSASQVVLLHMYMCPLLTTTGLNSTKFWMLLTCSLDKYLSRRECKCKGTWNKFS